MEQNLQNDCLPSQKYYDIYLQGDKDYSNYRSKEVYITKNVKHIRHHLRIAAEKIIEERDGHSTTGYSTLAWDFNAEEREERLYMEYIYEKEFLKSNEPSYKPEPSEMEIKEIILEAMKSKTISHSDISDGNASLMHRISKPTAYCCEVYGCGWFTCSNGHRVQYENASCIIDLRMLKICNRVKMPCKKEGCQMMFVEPEFPANTVKTMAEDAVRMFLTTGNGSPASNYRQYIQEPSAHSVRVMILNAMFKENILPSQIHEEMMFDLTTVRFNSKRYFNTKGLASFSCPNNHCWKSALSWCYIDLKMQRICHRYEMKCANCGTSVKPEFSLEAVNKMSCYVVNAYLLRTRRKEKKVEASDGDKTIPIRKPQETRPYEPEPAEAEVKELILMTMAEKDLSPSQIPREQVFELSIVTRNSKRYFCTRGFAWFLCPNEHRWKSSYSWCYLDLKTQKICYRYEQVCKNCRTPVKPVFSLEAIENMARYSIKLYLIHTEKKWRRDGVSGNDTTCTVRTEIMVRRDGNSRIFTVSTKKYVKEIISLGNNRVETSYMEKMLIALGGFGNPRICTGRKRNVQETPFEPEPSAEGIKAIIIKAMRNEGIHACHIPGEQKFDLVKAKPWSLRYYRTKGFGRLSCQYCRSSTTSCIRCYIDLSTQTICYRFKQMCKECGNLMQSQFSLRAVEKMASYSIDQLFNRIE